ncbi:MAG: hypothetical protein IT379_33160 [Deltaproteobacteria bacterium]|nr:hypothetical protein [Deltaproteobacteria bacterium]
MTALLQEVGVYVGRIRQFERSDWIVYLAWVGMMGGLVASTAGFLLAGSSRGVTFPPEAWLVPAGAALFFAAIAVDTIGHRTVYKEALRGAESLVHHITIFCGIGSVVMLVLAYAHPGTFAIPALVLTILSFVYSLVDEAFHWDRYRNQGADRVEMWSHVFIMTGHLVMMLAWWRWYQLGYPGVAETLAAFR